MLKGKHVLLGVSGGIAAYKACDLASRLMKEHADIHVVMTNNATEFVTPLTFDALTHNRTVTDTFDRQHSYEVEHISLADQADVVIIAPATANVIAKLANGMADDMLTTTVLACQCPKLIAPAMNTKMYENPVTQENIEKLKRFGWEVIEPDSGYLACGTTGKGKMVQPERLVEAIEHAISHEKDMVGVRLLVTAGPTREAVDPVRYLTNHSSGKMGYAIARAASNRGAEVTLVSGQTNLPKPSYVNFLPITSAMEMYDAVTERSEEQDIIIKAAAVADFKPAEVADNKMKKKDFGSDVSIPLTRTKDILQYLGDHKKEYQLLCGFSMETEHMLEHSREKLRKKHLDLICANNLKTAGAGFEVDTNILTFISETEERELPLLSKYDAANALLDVLLERYHVMRGNENA